jgi:hypothetical protein
MTWRRGAIGIASALTEVLSSNPTSSWKKH